ncbi:MAG TPA: formylglycine-generating enzyme family protein [Planctomycetota bacterium]|nr:formylglycine-generating enzyme family protein [Planctomycetota bacterium]
MLAIMLLAACSAQATEKIEVPGTKLVFEMVPLKGGPVKVGSPEGEKDRRKDEAVRELALQPFQIGARKVTWAEFNAYFETKDPPGVDAVTRPTRATAYFGQVEIPSDFLDPKRPVTNVRWHSAMGYCSWLSVKTGRYFRLPTEAEWEVAARAGSAAAGPEPLDDHAWHKGNSEERTHVGGEKKANAFGLYDTIGNLWEYALEPYELPGYGPVVRGGCWNSKGPELRFAHRQPILMEWFEADPNRPRSVWWLTSNDVSQGFRIVCVADASDQKERKEYAAKVEVKIIGSKERTHRVGTSTSFFMQVRGEIRNAGDRALDEAEVMVYYLDPKGRPHLADITGANKPGQATFSKGWPVLANSYADPAARVPLKPGETRAFVLDVPQTFDDPGTEVEKEKFAGRVTNLKFAK